ncbi:hypothetical protein MW887_007342 [Aspergillus wentii]|nr:hypothetical protein MW887_007342 [Aspergillus wentii]
MRTQRSLSLGLQRPSLGAAQSGRSYAIASDYSKSLYSLRRFSASARTQILLDDTEDLDDIEGADGHGHKGHNLNSLLRNRELGATTGKGGLPGKTSLARQRAAASRFNQHAGVKPVLSKEQVALKIKKINQEINQLELNVSSLPSINGSVSEYLHLKYVGFEAKLSRCATVNELLEQEYCRIRFAALPKLRSDVSRIAKSIPKFVQEFRQIEDGLRIAHLVLRSEALDESFSQIVGEFEQIAGPLISARRNIDTMLKPFYDMNDEYAELRKACNKLEDKLHTLGVPDMNREKGVFTVRKPLSQSRGRFLEWAENMDTHLWASWVLTSAIRAPPEYWRKVERRLAVDNKTRANKLELDAFGIPIMGSAEIGPTEPTEDLESIAGNPQESIAENLQESAKSIRKKRASLWRLVKKSFPAILIKTKAKPGLGPDNPKSVRPKVAPVGEKPRAQTAAQHKLKETSSGKSTDPNSIRKAPGSKTIPLRAGAVSVRKNKKNHTVGQTSKPYSTVASIRSNAGHNEDGKDDVQSREYENSIKQGDEANQTPILTKKLAATPHMSSQQAPSLDPATPKFWSHRLHKGSNEKAIVVHYCKSLRNTEEVAKLFLQDEIIGFDMEWKAQASSTDGIQDNVSLIQIANKDRIALFQIALFHPARNVQDLVSPSLKRVLESPDITKVGVSIKADCTRLQKYLGITARSIFELSHLFKLVKYCQTSPKLINKRAVNLSEQVEHHFGLPLEKDNDVRCSDWTRSLNYRQVQYAATDPYAGLCLFHTMDAKREALDPVPPRPAFAELGLPIRLAEAVVVEESKEVEVVETTVTSEIVSERA